MEVLNRNLMLNLDAQKNFFNQHLPVCQRQLNILWYLIKSNKIKMIVKGHKLQLQPLWDTHFISNWKQLVYRSTCLFQANPTLIELTGNTTKTQTWSVQHWTTTYKMGEHCSTWSSNLPWQRTVQLENAPKENIIQTSDQTLLG